MQFRITKGPDKDEKLNVQAGSGGIHRMSLDNESGLFLPSSLANKPRQVADILDDKGEIKEQREFENILPELEDENFRIPSKGWKIIIKNGIKVKENPEGDIWECLEGDFIGEQYFTQEAMIRETQKYGETVPSIKQWRQIMQAISPEIRMNSQWQNNIKIRKDLKLKFTGYYGCFGIFIGQGICGNYWTSANGYYVDFGETQILPLSNISSSMAMPVRCIKRVRDKVLDRISGEDEVADVDKTIQTLESVSDKVADIIDLEKGLVTTLVPDSEISTIKKPIKYRGVKPRIPGGILKRMNLSELELELSKNRSQLQYAIRINSGEEIINELNSRIKEIATRTLNLSSKRHKTIGRDVDYIKAFELDCLIKGLKRDLRLIRNIIITQEHIKVAGLEIKRYDEQTEITKGSSGIFKSEDGKQTLFTIKAAKKYIRGTGHEILSTTQLQLIVSEMPGNNTKEKIINFTNIFNISDAGYFYYYSRDYRSVGEEGIYWITSSTRDRFYSISIKKDEIGSTKRPSLNNAYFLRGVKKSKKN